MFLWPRSFSTRSLGARRHASREGQTAWTNISADPATGHAKALANKFAMIGSTHPLIVIAVAFGVSFVSIIQTGAQSLSRDRCLSSWSGFQVIMWQDKAPDQYRALAKLGITAAKVSADRTGESETGIARKLAPICEAGLGFYVENIATDFYSAYHRWFPSQPVNWRFLEAKGRLTASPLATHPFVREPSLSDPNWLARISARLRESARVYEPYHPLFFNLADEAGIADLTAFWDFDLSSYSLSGFRVWLRSQYLSLANLNREWGTNYQRWVDVVPERTSQAMLRADNNYSSWSDFKAWMDVAFARAISVGSSAIHASDTGAIAALEGVQIPGWGGYNYTRLVGTVDLMEMSTDDVALEIMRSLDPRVILLSTSTLAGPREEHDVWQHLLLGTRGLILWDEDDAFVRADGSLGRRGVEASETFRELTKGIGRKLSAAKPDYDPIAILYSPASFRVQWMLDQRGKGISWTERQAKMKITQFESQCERRFMAWSAKAFIQDLYQMLNCIAMYSAVSAFAC
jgi:hypothetical protein